MANTKWIALSYVCIFFAVFLGHIAYAFIPVYISEHYNTTLDTTNYANATMALSSAASTLPGLGALIILIIIVTVILFFVSGLFMNFGV